VNQGLFESITGRFKSGIAIEDVPLSERRVHSIQDNLARLFNCRAGALPHISDHGLPDISEICRNYPSGLDRLRVAILKCIEKYEPRIRGTRVELIKTDSSGQSIAFRVTAKAISGERLEFRTTFRDTANAKIEILKRRG
jgi:type VI secretion system protein